jgi:hypothetical protein
MMSPKDFFLKLATSYTIWIRYALQLSVSESPGVEIPNASSDVLISF